MKLACVAVAYKEERFIPKYIQAMQNRVDEIVVLNSMKPWFGEEDDEDSTGSIADSLGATVIRHDWATEHDQRNAGQEYLSDYDWIIVLDPDEYLLDADWENLVNFLETAEGPAYVTGMQHTYWKHGFVIDPPEDYKQIIAVRPQVRFFDKRCVNTPWGYAPTELHHFSWARSDQECLRKITHYAHANDFDTLNWFSEVWQDSERLTNLHPLTPESLKQAVRVELPEELERLNLWP
jgi:glycosyltransferase involved in cell wall biosynthesis